MAADMMRTSSNSQTEPFIPDDIIASILSKLEAGDVVRCRCVCKRWKKLASDEDFLESHMRPGPPMIFAISKITDDISRHYSLYLSNKWWEAAPGWTKCTCVVRKYRLHVYSGLNGFIFVRSGRSFDIINPINNSKTVRIFPPQNKFCLVFGIFLHPVSREYCTICFLCDKISPLGTSKVEYKMLNLGNQPCWRTIGNVSYPGQVPRLPLVCVEDFLFWRAATLHGDIMNHSESIMTLDIKTEKFSSMPFPDDCTPSSYSVTLQNLDGFLSICGMKSAGVKISLRIWKLKDRVSKLWTSSNYVLNIVNHVNRPCAQSIIGGQVVFHNGGTNCSEIFVGSLKDGTVRKFVFTPKHGKELVTTIWSLTPSLASLKKCKSVIRLDLDNKEEMEETPFSDEEDQSSSSTDIGIVEEKLIP